MPPLPTDLRTQLERTVIAARDTAETAARASLIALAVERDTPPAAMAEDARRLRRGLRAKARQLGGGDQAAGLPLLVDEIAYQQWHRMLFARFLAENSLLMHPAGVAVTLAECAELAPEEGAADAWALAARYASAMLPGLFPVDEPAVQVRFAREHVQALERLLDGLAADVFTSDDGLGWVYQFWQSKRKDEVNRSERKIGGADLYPVTQLFTEDYMVRFLLHNTLGAWWAGRHPDSPLLREFEYLRWVTDDRVTGGQGDTVTGGQGDTVTEAEADLPVTLSPPHPVTVSPPHPVTVSPPHPVTLSRSPAAGVFPGWPARVADVTMLDPSGGSGHFEVAALGMFVPMRMEEEGLSEEEAVRAVLRDNLFMLDIDPRCCQIAAFNLLLAAWKRMGYRDDLPVPHIACSGIAVKGQLDDWLRLAGDDVRLQTSLTRLHSLFRDAPTLGSLIDPSHIPLNERLFSADYDAVLPVLEQALGREQRADDPASAVLGEATKGVLQAARLLGRQYTLVATNVPYLGLRLQAKMLQDYICSYHHRARHNLATAFVERCLSFCTSSGSVALVTPQNWLFQSTYQELRKETLASQSWNMVARLGTGAFETISGAVVNVALCIISNHNPRSEHHFIGIDASRPKQPTGKSEILALGSIKALDQFMQRRNPAARVTLEQLTSIELLEQFAIAPQGIKTGDDDRWRRFFWEATELGDNWRLYQSTVTTTQIYGGREQIINWKHQGSGMVRPRLGNLALGKIGVAIKQIGELPVTMYTGELYDSNVAPLVPKADIHLLGLWAFCSSPEYNILVREIDRGWKVSNVPLIQVPFDLEHWTQVAQERYPDGLPPPWSNDPTQWLFNGHPVGSTEPLHVAVARLLGYPWPENGKDDGLDAFADRDGIVCLSAVVGEQPAAERLRGLLAHAYSHPPALPDFERYRVGDFVPTTPVPPDAGWSPATQGALLAQAGYADASLDDWLRDGFFEQHVRLFHNRPFLWHVWDGRRDGFHALVNYHKLDAALLDKLIYTYLGAWIADQRAERDADVPGADGRLVASLALQKKLVAIREGEPPYDIYVRWKGLAEQPAGWTPDLNDGVRLNLRPWVTAGVLRRKFTVHWRKDRGKNPDGSERLNDLHVNRAQKLAARGRKD